jgi:hypothetical protein
MVHFNQPFRVIGSSLFVVRTGDLMMTIPQDHGNERVVSLRTRRQKMRHGSGQIKARSTTIC